MTIIMTLEAAFSLPFKKWRYSCRMIMNALMQLATVAASLPDEPVPFNLIVSSSLTTFGQSDIHSTIKRSEANSISNTLKSPSLFKQVKNSDSDFNPKTGLLLKKAKSHCMPKRSENLDLDFEPKFDCKRRYKPY